MDSILHTGDNLYMKLSIELGVEFLGIDDIPKSDITVTKTYHGSL